MAAAASPPSSLEEAHWLVDLRSSAVYGLVEQMNRADFGWAAEDSPKPAKMLMVGGQEKPHEDLLRQAVCRISTGSEVMAEVVSQPH